MSFLTRRSALGLGLGGAGLLAVGGVGLGLRGSAMRSPRQPLGALTPLTFSVLAALSERINPAVDGLPSGWEVQVPERVDQVLAAMEPGYAAELNQGLILVENAVANLLFEGRPHPFTVSPPDVQTAVWASWGSSRIATRRTLYKSVTALCTSSYWSHQELWKAVGYPGPPL